MIIVTHDDRVAALCDQVMTLPDRPSAIEPSEQIARA
jgi:ABC-type lipoprotein export system ATPase subunit